jgi:hypothetical protein
MKMVMIVMQATITPKKMKMALKKTATVMIMMVAKSVIMMVMVMAMTIETRNYQLRHPLKKDNDLSNFVQEMYETDDDDSEISNTSDK